MPIQYASKLSSATANNTFLDKTIDDAKKGVLTLYKVSIGEADAIADTQVTINQNIDDIEELQSRADVPNEAYYFGDSSTDGSFRIIKDGAELKIQARVSSVWTTLQAFSL